MHNGHGGYGGGTRNKSTPTRTGGRDFRGDWDPQNRTGWQGTPTPDWARSSNIDF